MMFRYATSRARERGIFHLITVLRATKLPFTLLPMMPADALILRVSAARYAHAKDTRVRVRQRCMLQRRKARVDGGWRDGMRAARKSRAACAAMRRAMRFYALCAFEKRARVLSLPYFDIFAMRRQQYIVAGSPSAH